MTKLNYVQLFGGAGLDWGRGVGVWCISARALRYLPLGLRVVAAYPAWFLKNVARNSPASISDFEIVSLGLQRLWGVSKNDQVKLRATFRGGAGLGRSWVRLWGRGARLGCGALRASSSEPVQQRDVGERSGADAPQELAPAEQVDGDRHARGGQGHPPVVSRRVGVVCQRR